MWWETETFETGDPSVQWPSLEFWADATAVLRAIETPDLMRIVEALKQTAMALHGASGMEARLRSWWARGWDDIDAFTTEHPPRSSRSVASIAVAYFTSIVALLLVDPKHASVDDPHRPLLGTCIGMIYTDAHLDDPNVDTETKQRFVGFVHRRFSDPSVEAYDAPTRAAVAAFRMIEESSTSDATYAALTEILRTHHASALARGSPRTDEELRRVAMALGAQTGLTLAATVSQPDARLERTLSMLGAWMQLLDDAADVEDDVAEGIETYATRVLARDGCLDAYWMLLRDFTERAVAAVRDTAKHGRAGARVGEAIAFGMLMVASMSHAKMAPRLRGEVVDANLAEFYRIWRAAYEITVQRMMLDVRMKHASVIGKVVLSMYRRFHYWKTKSP